MLLRIKVLVSLLCSFSYYSSFFCMLSANKGHVGCHERLDPQSLVPQYIEILSFLSIFLMVVGFGWIIVRILALSLE